MERTIALFSFFPLRLRTLSAAGSYLPAFKPREEPFRVPTEPCFAWYLEEKVRRWLSKEALGTNALGASARIGPLAKGAYESFSKGAGRKAA
jgi:hypothetical protein